MNRDAVDAVGENPLTLDAPRTHPWEQRPRAVGQDPQQKRHEDADIRSSAGPPVAAPSASLVDRLTLDFQEEYAGETSLEAGQRVPHGYGAQQSAAGRHCYVGGFAHGWRDGYGQLISPRFSLWCRWRSNRPDTTHGAVRLDDSSGTRYCGTVQLARQRGADRGGSTHGLSKFSLWVQQVRLNRHGWGELVLNDDGARYFGEWSEDVPHGFGCYLTASGDRYIGHLERSQFHGVGALFLRAATSSTLSTLSHLDGVPLRGGGVRGSYNTRVARAVDEPFRGAVFDGVWCRGRLEGEGHATLPQGARVTADWLGPSHAQNGETVWPGRAPSNTHGLGAPPARRECFHWEALLGGARDDVRQQERARFADLRGVILQFANSPEHVRTVVTSFLQSEQSMVQSALQIFVRCFFFLHGVCTGATVPTAAAGAKRGCVGWCQLRQPFGGCIHGEGRATVRKTQADIDLALCDLLSFTRSVQRWVCEVLAGPADADDGHREAALDALQRCGAEQHVGRWTIDSLLADLDGVLFHLYESVYSAEETSTQLSIRRLRDVVTLDDLGVDFARRVEQERLFNPYVDAVRCVEQLCQGGLTLTRSLQLLVRVSREIDVATRLTLSDDGTASGAGRGGGNSAQGHSHKAFQSGSADDLLPIHQYVLSKANAPALYARTKLLCDLGLEPSFVDQTSQEGFCLTTLQVCVWTLSQLHPFVRDASRVLVPPTVVREAMQQTVTHCEDWVRSQRASVASLSAEFGTLTDADLAHVCRRSAARWLPQALVSLAGAGTRCRTVDLSVSPWPEQVNLVSASVATHSTLAALRWLCGRFAAYLLVPLSMQLECFLGGDDRWIAVADLPLDAVDTFTSTNQESDGQRAFRVQLLRPALPSLLLLLAESLTSSL